MTQPLPRRTFHTLVELQSRWTITASDLYRWLVGGYLRAHVWLPVMSVYRKVALPQGAGVAPSRMPHHWEGFAPVSRHYCHRLFRHGRVTLREIACEKSGERYWFPESADDVEVHLHDLVVLEEECCRFEAVYRIGQPSNDAAGEKIIADPAFKILRSRGRVYRMGDMQADVLRRLYLCGKEGQPWQSGKLLLREVGSESFSLSNLFKRNSVWRELVASDGRGSYRLKSGAVRIEGD